MEFEFDKEMDSLLRQAAQGETASVNSKFKIQNSKLPHLDADEISIFAENALPKKLRENAVAHFADCDRCRRILSDLIAQNLENEIVSAKQADVFAPNIPWYRSLFAFPNLAYTLGALVLVFSGLIAFTVLQSVDNSKNSEVSQVSERQTGGGKGMSSDGEAEIVERNADVLTPPNMSPNDAMSNASMSNSASSSNATMSNAPLNSAARSSNANSASNVSTVSNKSSVSANASPKAEPRTEGEAAKPAATDLAFQGATAQNLAEEKRERGKDDKKSAETSDMTKTSPASPKPTEHSVSVDGVDKSDADSVKAKKMARAQSVETTSVGGKTFKRADNVWVDSAYKGQPAAVITRGTKEYKKLDSGLRSIVENLGGTIIVVWKDKAYRIQ